MINLKAGEHAVIFGRNGSGKTVYVRELLKLLRVNNPDAAIIILNQKEDDSFDEIIKPESKCLRFKSGMLYNWYVPSDTAETKASDLIETFLMDAWAKCKRKKQKIFIIADEGQALNSRSFILQTAWTQGRSKGFSVITLAQRPVWLSKFCISQSRYLIVYNVLGMDDLKAIDDYMESSIKRYIQPEYIDKHGNEIKAKKLPEFNFLEYDVKTGNLTVNKPVDITPNHYFVEPKKPINKWVFLPLAFAGLLLF